MSFSLQKGGAPFIVRTEQAAQIQDAIMKQATLLKEERDAAAVVKAEAVLLKKEMDAAAVTAAAAEAAKWLTLAQLIAGDYSSCTRQPVDEQTKELWLCDAEFL